MSNSPSQNSLSLSEAQINFANILAESCAIPGTGVCFLVLVAYSIAACFPRARKHMDRISFRLIIYALTSNVLFGIAYAATPFSPGLGCNWAAFAVNFFLSFSTFFTTCIAINLQLVVVHHIDGQTMEKYYVIGTTLLSILLNVPAFGLHQFGWDKESTTCWYNNPDPSIRLKWIIGTQSFWIALAATIETICSCVILVFMYLCQKHTKELFRIARHRGSLDITQDPRYRKAILRIALYPIVSLIVNYSTTALDLNVAIQGLNTQLGFRLLILDLFLYGIRTLFYGLLAAFDPAFTTALREMRGKNKTKPEKSFTKLKFASMLSDESDNPSQGITTRMFNINMVQSHFSSDLTAGLERLPNAVIREHRDPEQIRLAVLDKTGQDLEKSVHYDRELEFTKIERQL